MSTSLVSASNWQWRHFDTLTTRELYQVLKARLAVFSLEQKCYYQDADDLDFNAWHLLGWNAEKSELLAYLRLLPPATAYPEPSIGRILTTRSARGSGLGNSLVQRGIEKAEHLFPNQAIRIGAQLYLKNFYGKFGFEIDSAPYDEDGIEHIQMIRKPS